MKECTGELSDTSSPRGTWETTDYCLDIFTTDSIIINAAINATCEVVKAVMLEDLIQDAKKLPHLGGDSLTGEAKCQ